MASGRPSSRGRTSLVPPGEAPLVRGGRKGPVPPRPGCGGLLAAGRGWQVCRGWRQSCCPGGEIPASAFVPQSLLSLGKMWDRAVPSCSVCSHVFLLPLLLSPPLPSAARWSCSSSPAPAAAPRLPHVCYPFLSCPAVEASSARGPGCSGSLGFVLWSDLLGTMTFLTEPLLFIARHLPKTAGLTPNTCIFIYFPHNLLNLLALSSVHCHFLYQQSTPCC